MQFIGKRGSVSYPDTGKWIVFSSFRLLFLILTLFFLSAEMTTKFNQELYTKIKAKKNEPLSSIGAQRLRVVEKEKEKEVTKKGLSTPTLDEGRSASPGVFIEEVIPAKKRKTGDKGKKKVRASIWADAETTMARANEVMTPEELKEISNVPFHEMVNRHVHKLVQVAFHLFCCFFFLLPLSVDCFSRSFCFCFCFFFFVLFFIFL